MRFPGFETFAKYSILIQFSGAAGMKGEVNRAEAQRPLKNAPFCSISASGSNFNPRNTQCIPVVKIIAFLELKQKLTFFKGLYEMQHNAEVGLFTKPSILPWLAPTILPSLPGKPILCFFDFLRSAFPYI